MRRVPPQERKRARILSDAELRAIWTAAAANGAYGAMLQLSLLAAQRCAKTVTMRWADVSAEGVWTIPAAPREKGNAGSLRLPPLALQIIAAQPRLAGNPYVFAGRLAGRPLSGFSTRHETFKQRCGVDGWTVHDCRRTARSLMARAGVLPHVAERVLGHTIPGVEGVYDRHRYDAEKADALQKLARLIEQIVGGKPNVVPLRATQS
jgi:integrase